MTGLGSEAAILRRRALGSGLIALPGNSHSGKQENQTTSEEINIAFGITSITHGMIINAVRNTCLYAARRFAQVTFKETLPDFSVTSCNPKIFSKYHFAAASSIPKSNRGCIETSPDYLFLQVIHEEDFGENFFVFYLYQLW